MIARAFDQIISYRNALAFLGFTRLGPRCWRPGTACASTAGRKSWNAARGEPSGGRALWVSRGSLRVEMSSFRFLWLFFLWFLNVFVFFKYMDWQFSRHS